MLRRFLFFTMTFLTMLGGDFARAAEPKPLEGVRRAVFLGDSITYAGQYIEYVEAFLRTRDPKLTCEFLNIGLPSETVSGLSEPGHAGGQFPRPTLHERLDRVLAATKPDLIIAGYGMNDGIYYPYSLAHLEKYQEGIRQLRAKARQAGARVIHLTPPVFDANPIKARTLPAGLAEYKQPYVGYDDVLNLYAAWLKAERGSGWDVIDIHSPMERALIENRQRDPGFQFAGDGVHANAAGHWLIAREVLLSLGIPAKELNKGNSGEEVLASLPHGAEVLKLVQKRQRLLKDAWLTATGHKRPGMSQGLSLKEAQAKAEEIEAAIQKELGTKP